MTEELWHNEEAEELCEKIKLVIKAWGCHAICPNEFLLSLDRLVDDAKKEKQRRIEENRQ